LTLSPNRRPAQSMLPETLGQLHLAHTVLISFTSGVPAC
jgi:hypothetical protein